MSRNLDPILVLTGPTASGKSDVGVIMAERLNTEIISADSVQLYKSFDIGSAKPDASLLSRVPHHMIDIATPDEEFNVAQYRDMAKQVAQDLAAKGKIPLVVGGSGLYIRGLTRGLDCAVKVSDEVNEKLNSLFSKSGQAGLFAKLMEVDPAWASNLHPNDTFRTRRALGVYMTADKTMSAMFAINSDEPAWDTLYIALDLPRAVLYRRIERRIDMMLLSGWFEEVIRLKEMGYNGQTKPMRSIGYRTLYKESEGRVDREETRRIIIKDTKAYARRQLTWLRKMENVIYIPIEGNEHPETITNQIFSNETVKAFTAKRRSCC